jgi:hypothetical protein
MCRLSFRSLDYIVYKLELLDKGHDGINLVKGKHYNIISHHPLSHTKVANFDHYYFSQILSI